LCLLASRELSSFEGTYNINLSVDDQVNEESAKGICITMQGGGASGSCPVWCVGVGFKDPFSNVYENGAAGNPWKPLMTGISLKEKVRSVGDIFVSISPFHIPRPML
jgi:hypothetical protein